MKISEIFLVGVTLVAISSGQWLEATITFPDSSWSNSILYNILFNKIYTAKSENNRG